MKSSETVILVVMNAILAIAEKPEKLRNSTGFDTVDTSRYRHREVTGSNPV